MELIRKSQVMHWKKCPKMYEDIWIEKIPTLQTVEQNFGTMFHMNAHEFFVNLEKDDFIGLEECVTQKQAYELFLDYTPSLNPIVNVWFDNFLRFEAARWIQLHDVNLWKPQFMELTLEAPAVGFLMHIDRIDRLQSGFYINIDYKTSKYMNLADLRFELTFYNIGINSTSLLDKTCTWVGCYNPALMEVFVEEVKTRTVKRVMKTVSAFRAAKARGEFPPKPQFLCRYCSSLNRCLEAGYFTQEFLEKMNAWRKEE